MTLIGEERSPRAASPVADRSRPRMRPSSASMRLCDARNSYFSLFFLFFISYQGKEIQRRTVAPSHEGLPAVPKTVARW